MSMPKPYLVSVLVLLWIYTCARCPIGSHCRIPIFSEVEDILLFVVMYALDYLGAHKGALGDYAFKRYHTVQVRRA